MDIRQAYREKFIKDLKDSEFVAVSGMVVNRNDNGLLIDDGTGQIMIGINNNIEQGKYVRILGRVILYDNILQIQGEILQDLNDIDKKLHMKLKELLNR